MEHYFIVLQLPGSEEHRFGKGGESPAGFRAGASAHIASGEAKILCKRNDTGIAEELRKHIKKLRKFTTYLLIDMPLAREEQKSERTILQKAAKWLKKGRHEMIIDNSHNFQLITVT